MTACARSGAPVTVLLIEDDPDDALLIRTLLAKSRYEFELLWRDRLDYGLECAAENAVELILLDLSLPDSHGIETVERTVAAAGDLPVVVVSGLDDPEAERAALVAGAKEYLVKGPMDANQFGRILIHAIERHSVERALDEKDEFARAVLDQSGESIYFTDAATGTVLLCNPAFERMLGYEPGAVAGLRLPDLIDADPASIRDQTEQVMATGEGGLIERRYRHRDGHLIPVEATASAIDLGGRSVLCTHVRDISERKRAEEALRQALEQTRQRAGEVAGLLRAARGVIEGADFSDAARAVHQACCELTGATAGYVALLAPDHVTNEVVYLDPGNNGCTVDPSLPMPVRGLRAEAYRTGQAVYENDFAGSELEQHLPGGHVALDNVLFAPLHINGRPDGLIGLANKPGGFTDDDARIALAFAEVATLGLKHARAQDALRASEQRYRTLFSSAGDGIAMIDLRGRLLDANQVFLDQLGYGIDELRAKTLADLVTPDIAQRLPAWYESLGAEGRWLVESVLVAKDGRTIPMEVSAQMVEVPGGRAVLGICRDVSERRAAEESRRRLAAALDAAAESVVITDTRGNIRYVNRAFERVTGYVADEVLGLNPKILKSGEHPPEFYRELWNTVLDGRVWSGRITNQRKDGTRYVAGMTISPIFDGNAQIVEFIAIQQDVTAEVELQAKLSRSQTLQAVGQLAGGVAHDFNNILMTVRGFADLVYEDLGPDHPSRDDLREILNASERGAGLAHQLLAFSRQEAAQPVEVRLNEVLKDVEKMLRRTIGENVLLTLDLASDLPAIFIDPVHLHQVILNLVVNARDAMPTGGELTIRTAMCPPDEDTSVCLEVTDTGCGMSDEVQARIFEPYFTTKQVGSRSGSGLGLATVYGIVRQAGGRIEVASAVGSGSAFQVHLPPAVEAGPGRTPSDAEPLPVGRGETLLVVEDDPAVAGPVARLLTNGNYRVLMAYSGQEALRLAADHGRELDMLITDVIMPGMSGPELAELLVQTHPGLRVLFVSGYAGAPIADHGIDPARQPFLAKPFTKDALLRKIRQVLGDGAATDA